MTRMKIKIISKKRYKEIEKIKKELNVVSGKETKADICIAIGGDGTFIRAAKEFDGPILPIRANDLDSMGYYADVSTDNINEVIRLLKTNAFKIKTISKMITLHYKNRKYYAVNEILLRNKLEEVYFDIEINGRKEKNNSFKISGDGFIVTNLIGSTAYNRSAGGPIILTQKAICITFLNADGPFKNSIILDPDSKINVAIKKYNGIIRCDSENIAEIKPGERFKIELSDRTIRIIQFDKFIEPFFKKINRALADKMITGE